MHTTNHKNIPKADKQVTRTLVLSLCSGVGTVAAVAALAATLLGRILGVHDMQQASRKAESGDHKHAVNDT